MKLFFSSIDYVYRNSANKSTCFKFELQYTDTLSDFLKTCLTEQMYLRTYFLFRETKILFHLNAESQSYIYLSRTLYGPFNSHYRKNNVSQRKWYIHFVNYLLSEVVQTIVVLMHFRDGIWFFVYCLLWFLIAKNSHLFSDWLLI